MRWRGWSGTPQGTAFFACVVGAREAGDWPQTGGRRRRRAQQPLR